MTENDLFSYLSTWNFWDKDLNTGVFRPDYVDKIIQYSAGNNVTVVTGVRRSGKSYLLRQTARKLIDSGVPKNNILIINFEDPRFEETTNKILETLFDLYKKNLDPKGQIYVILDEIHRVPEWERWVRMMHELERAKIIVSGSNSHLLSREWGTVLTGRHLDIAIYPLSFSEFLSFKKNNYSITLFEEYRKFGGFPVVVQTLDKEPTLLAHFNDIISEDIVKRFSIRREQKLRDLARYYAGNPGGLMTFNSLKKFLEISETTAERFSRYFEESYLFYFLPRFSTKIKEQEKSPRKVYAVDLGFLSSVGFQNSQNLGASLENLVYLELKRRISNLGGELYYWKDQTHKEVDFLVWNKGKIEKLIQVCWDPQKPETQKREVGSLNRAMEELSVNEGTVITYDFEGEEVVGEKIIKFIPVTKWLDKNN